MAENMVLRMENVTMQFGGVVAVNDLSLDVPEGKIVALIGPNGAGKTTAFNCITGVYQPTNGSVEFMGETMICNHPTGKRKKNNLGKNPDKFTRQRNIDPTPDFVVQKGIARTFQNIRLFNNMTVVRNVMVGLHNQPDFKCGLFTSLLRLPRHFRVEKAMRQRAKEILNVVGLLEDRNNLACNLPYGKQRKLEIARALATNPKILLLDEPAAGMNPHETEDLAKTIRFIRDHFDMTILLIEHDMNFVSDLCDELTVLSFGTVLSQGKTKDVLQDPKVIKAYIGG